MFKVLFSFGMGFPAVLCVNRCQDWVLALVSTCSDKSAFNAQLSHWAALGTVKLYLETQVAIHSFFRQQFLLCCEMEVKRNCTVRLLSCLCCQSLMHSEKLLQMIKWYFRDFCHSIDSSYRKILLSR